MKKESHQSFPQHPQFMLLQMTIEGELKKEGIILAQFGVEDLVKRVYAVTTDKPVPDPTMKIIQEDAKHKGITIKFLTSE